MTAPAPAEASVASRRPTPEAVADIAITVLLLALFAGAFLAAGDWSFRAALFPRLVTGAGVVLAALHLVQALLRLRRPAPAVGADDSDPDDVEYVFRTAGPRRWASTLGWVAGFFVLLYLAGLYVTAPVFSLLYLRFAGKRTWIFSAIYAIVIAVVLYVAFELALGVPTPSGLLLD
ncbi:tripartite tricarboxylate transporter TctB family protein [Pseudonocardia sp. DLS-67]